MNSPSEASPRLSVLYVEDHPINVLVMSRLIDLRPELELTVATTGQQALCVASRLHASLVLLDLQLPDCHGSELLPLLRLLPGCQAAPAVAVTADSGFDIRGTGFTELWPKPLDMGWVLQRLDTLIAIPPRVPNATPAMRAGTFHIVTREARVDRN